MESKMQDQIEGGLNQMAELEKTMDQWTKDFLSERGGFANGYNSTEILYWLAGKDLISRSRVIAELEGMKITPDIKSKFYDEEKVYNAHLKEAIERIKNLK